MIKLNFFALRPVHCVDKVGTEVCHWRISNGHQCRAPYMQQDCAATCGICGMLSNCIDSSAGPLSRSIWNLETLVFQEEGKP